MTDYSSLTKAGLLEEIGRLKDQVANAPVRPPRTVRVPEADALAECIRAIDQIPATNSDSYSRGVHPDGRAVARVLRSLADRYGVALVETKYEPCNRRHVEEIDANAIGYMIRNAIGGAS